MTTASPAPLKLCTKVITPDGEIIQCRVVGFEYDYESLFPKLKVKSSRLNAAGRAIVKGGSLFAARKSAGRGSVEPVQS